MKWVIQFACFALALVLVACGPGVSTEGVAVESSTLRAPAYTEMSCSGAWAAFFEVDPGPAQALLTEGYKLSIFKSAFDGVTDVAQLTLTAITCETFTWDGVNYPTSMLMATIAIDGPFELEPIPGAAQTLPTGYGYVVLEQVTNQNFKEKVAGYGERTDLVASIDLGGPTAATRVGSLVQLNGRAVTWSEPEVQVSPIPFPLGARGVQYWRVGNGDNSAPIAGDTACLEYINGMGPINGMMHLFILTADADSEFGRLGLGTQLFGAAIDADLIQCTGHLFRAEKGSE